MADNRFTITLSEDISAEVRARVAGPGYPSVDMLVEDALHKMFSNNFPPMEAWEIQDLNEALDELDANPSDVFTPEQVLQHIETEAQRLLMEERQLSKAG